MIVRTPFVAPSCTASASQRSFRFRHITGASILLVCALTLSGCRDHHYSPLLHRSVAVGRVLDATNNAPIVGATITDLHGRQAISDPQGEFALPLPVGPDRLDISSPGYRSGIATIEVAADHPTLAGNQGYIRLLPVLR